LANDPRGLRHSGAAHGRGNAALGRQRQRQAHRRESWSLDYDNATLSPDGSLAEIDHVHDGVILRDGKPYMHMTAKHVSANLSANDFVVTGPVSFNEVGGQHRQLNTDEAHYLGNAHTLYLDHPTTIRAAGMTFRVVKAEVNFTTGETKLGRINGSL
jgi:lipopolysaccharide export system protein LptC